MIIYTSGKRSVVGRDTNTSAIGNKYAISVLNPIIVDVLEAMHDLFSDGRAKKLKVVKQGF